MEECDAVTINLISWKQHHDIQLEVWSRRVNPTWQRISSEGAVTEPSALLLTSELWVATSFGSEMSVYRTNPIVGL